MTTTRDRTRRRSARDARLGVFVAGVVVLLTGIVWWSLPKGPPESGTDAATSSQTAPEGGPPTLDVSAKIPRLGEAVCELAVLTSKTRSDVARIATPAAAAALLEGKHCGALCDGIKRWLGETSATPRFEVEVTTAEDYILPPDESLDVVGSSLTKDERRGVAQRGTVVVVRTRGAVSPEHLPARAGFAVASALAEALDGLVYDEVLRRIESARHFRERVTTARAFSPTHIVVLLYREESGETRLVTLGMARFGSPDFVMRAPLASTGTLLGNVINTVASRIAAADSLVTPLVVTPNDIATLVERDAAAGEPIELDVEPAQRASGDPENALLELVVRGRSVDDAVARLFGASPQVVFTGFDAELAAIAERARRDLPDAIRRHDAGDGALFVKAPFPFSRPEQDAGPSFEWMWVEIGSCDARTCRGQLSNDPSYATNLAAGSSVVVEREKAADWLLRLPDGGTEGGASIAVLKRAP